MYILYIYDVPRELLEQFEIPQKPIIFRGSESSDEVAKQFVLAVADIAGRLCELLKTTNVPIIMSDEQTWMSKYIDLNTEKRKGAVNEFEKDFFKLMNNAVFGTYFKIYIYIFL